ncbi:MAG TPA: hypothetical protein VK150_07375, partial [Geothrix sp.]|nr:hypothetical protein [Geothrix sp.]
MDPHSPSDQNDRDLAGRVARLEAQVAWLLQRQQAPAPQAAPSPAPGQAHPAPGQTQPAPAAAQGQPLPRPILRPPTPRKEISPVVWIAGIGASIFLFGTIFFFRWAIQQGWVG